MGDTDLDREKKVMTNEFIRKQDAVDMCGGYGCLAHLMSTIKPADVVQVVRCQNCKYHTYDEIFASFWCEYPGRVRDTTPDGFCEKGEG